MDSNGNPTLAVDAIIELPDDKIVLVERKYEPHGLAIPGGIVDYGESCEHAVVREAKEETGADVEIVCQLHTYSDPQRDPRKHVASVVFVCRHVSGALEASSDAKALYVVDVTDPAEWDIINRRLVFDHPTILRDYLAWKARQDG